MSEHSAKVSEKSGKGPNVGKSWGGKGPGICVVGEI